MGYKFYDPTTKSIFETINARFFEDVEFTRGERINDFVFEEEYIDIHPIAVDNNQDHVIIPNFIQQVNTDLENVIEPPL